MKSSINLYYKLFTMILAVILCICISCKKTDNDPGIIDPVFLQRVAGITEFEGGMEKYKDFYYYDGNKLASNYKYRYNQKGEWIYWLRYIYEYPEQDVIIEIQQGIDDTNWLNTLKWEKHFSGEQIVELTAYTWMQEGGGLWLPLNRINWYYEQGHPTIEMTTRFENSNWVNYSKKTYEYDGNVWIGSESYLYINGEWDAYYRSDLIYNTAKLLTEVRSFNYFGYGGWSPDKQFILTYEGDLVRSMVINKYSPGGAVGFDREITVWYNDYGNPAHYSVFYGQGQWGDKSFTYGMGKGNFRQATAVTSEYLIWPWFPAPVKSRQ